MAGGRNNKLKFDYFSVTSTFFNDPKFSGITEDCGPKAGTALAVALGIIYQSDHGYYTPYDRNLLVSIKRLANFESTEDVKRCIDSCMTNGYFEETFAKEKEILTSHDIQLNYVSMTMASKRGPNGYQGDPQYAFSLIEDKYKLLTFQEVLEQAPKKWKDKYSELIGDNSELIGDNSELIGDNSELIQQSKVNKSKVKESRENIKEIVSLSDDIKTEFEGYCEKVKNKEVFYALCPGHRLSLDEYGELRKLCSKQDIWDAVCYINGQSTEENRKAVKHNGTQFALIKDKLDHRGITPKSQSNKEAV